MRLKFGGRRLFLNAISFEGDTVSTQGIARAISERNYNCKQILDSLWPSHLRVGSWPKDLKVSEAVG